ncbi:hypothetical protein N1851_003934 [Merluccius polli]|uniref:Uncharacterized protein n=1 Tax=Merluccius polli TaxID=89951 RepID=A0AA47PA26_MERPO|nr:hypothetical protein N1851_003934 [Merluccius polli]
MLEHTKIHEIVERGIGQMQRRFHVLHGEIRLREGKYTVITVCAILHNRGLICGMLRMSFTETACSEQPITILTASKLVHENRHVRIQDKTKTLCTVNAYARQQKTGKSGNNPDCNDRQGQTEQILQILWRLWRSSGCHRPSLSTLPCTIIRSHLIHYHPPLSRDTEANWSIFGQQNRGGEEER